jgi:hypothetical protein
MFAKEVRVSSTSIFGRMVAPGVQGLAYGMTVEAKRDVAMILPLPVRPGGGPAAVRFVDLSAHGNMFRELAALFPEPAPLRKGGLSLPRLLPRLEVHAVGSFIASYVPTRADFERLDPRFRVPEVLFDAVPEYADYGFAVFQLAPGASTVHPMAFTFPTRELERLYFPCVHLHDGTWHPTAKFDHALYYQHPKVVALGATNDGDPCSTVLPARDYGRLVDAAHPILRREIRGTELNADVWIATGRPSTLLDT